MNRQVIIPYPTRMLCNTYCNAVRALTGADPAERSRRWVVVYSRMMVAHRLLLEGCTQHSVANLLGVDHATINHYRQRMGTILSTPGYEGEQELWYKFNDTTI